MPGRGGAHGNPPSGAHGNPPGGGTACSGTPGPGTEVTRCNPVVARVLGLLGEPASTELINDVDIVVFAGMNYGIKTYGSIQQIPGVASVNSGGPYQPYVGGMR